MDSELKPTPIEVELYAKLLTNPVVTSLLFGLFCAAFGYAVAVAPVDPFALLFPRHDQVVVPNWVDAVATGVTGFVLSYLWAKKPY